MANEMRDRLVEVFKKIEYTSFLGSPFKASLGNQFTDYALYSICDDLIENGVIVPPCKVGDDIWWVYGDGKEDNEVRCQENDVKAVCYFGNGDFKIISQDEMMPEDIGTRWCMFTKSEAEQKLNEMRGE